MRRLVLTSILFCAVKCLLAQDTISVFQYNILRYGEANCKSVNDKNVYLKTILDYYQPDIIGVNELYTYDNYAFNILINVLNKDQDLYAKAEFTTHPSSSLYNMLFYRKDKLELVDQFVSNTNTRNIDHYKLYLKSSKSDSVFIEPIVMHLKAGSSSDDKDRREIMVKNMMNSLTGKNNWLAMGDFNIQSSTESSFQLMINPTDTTLRFHDPVDALGSFNNSSTFKAYHTQSPRTSDLGDCGVTGGLDDRFDFILISDAIKNEEQNLKYVPNSYETPGQDANRLNSSLLSPSNSSLPSSVLNALYYMSDHLPVILKLTTNKINTSLEEKITPEYEIIQKGNTIEIRNGNFEEVVLIDIAGNQVASINSNDNISSIDLSGLTPGLYLLKINVTKTRFNTHKIIVR